MDSSRDVWTIKGIIFGVLLVLVGGCESGDPDSHNNTSPDSAMIGTTPPPSVLLVTIDTTRADALGAYGQMLPTTPHIDRLARRGVVFRNAVSAAPNTLPSHASIMTATYPFVHGARSNDGYVLAGENVTLAEVLKDHGYRTAAEIDAAVLNRHTGMNQGFDSYRDLDSPDIQGLLPPGAEGVKRRHSIMAERRPGDVTQSAIDFLRATQADPFFLWVHYFMPHFPYSPPARLLAQVQNDPYLGEVRYADHEIGVLLEALDDLKRTANTLIVIASDHGEARGEHGEDTHSLLVYDSTVRVPLIMAGPGGIAKDSEIHALVRLIDVAPTILELLGFSPLKNAQGVSLAPLLRGQSADLGLVAYGESLVATELFNSSVLRFLRRGDWKYIHKVNPELYNLREDPSETHNLARSEPELLGELRLSLRDLISNSPEPIQSKRIELTPLQERQLAMLGYVTGGSGSTPVEEMNDFAQRGPDPNELMDDMRSFARAQGGWSAGRFEEAFERFKALATRHPGSRRLVQSYLATSVALKHYEDAFETVDRTVERGAQLDIFRPDHLRSLSQRIDVSDDEAPLFLERMLEYDPCNPGVTARLAASYHMHGRYIQERDFLESGISQCAPSLERLNNLAYLLASSPVDSVRNGDRAVELAIRAAEMSRYTPPVLDTLAAAYAEVGDFGRAVSTSRKALALLDARGAPAEMRNRFQKHLNLFTQGKPLRDTPDHGL